MNTRTRIVTATVAAACMIAAGGGTAAALARPSATRTATNGVAASAVTQQGASQGSGGFTWHPLHLLNGWTALSARIYGTPSYAVNNGVLYLSGILQAPHPTIGPEFAVLPASARPRHFMWVIYYNFGGGGTNLVGNMEIEPGGGMFAYSNGGTALNPSLQAISFPLSS
jgi:hypothetical protein